MKTCNTCVETKPLEAFRLERLGVLGRQWLCPPCHRRVHLEAKVAA